VNLGKLAVSSSHTDFGVYRSGVGFPAPSSERLNVGLDCVSSGFAPNCPLESGITLGRESVIFPLGFTEVGGVNGLTNGFYTFGGRPIFGDTVADIARECFRCEARRASEAEPSLWEEVRKILRSWTRRAAQLCGSKVSSIVRM